jgi:ribosomal protein S27AE
MDVEFSRAPTDHSDYKLVCEQCGSLTVALPLEALLAPHSPLKCGRCGAPRGTLQALRAQSTKTGLKYPGL